MLFRLKIQLYPPKRPLRDDFLTVEIRRPSACQSPYSGRFTSPLPPSALGPLAAKVGPESSIRTLSYIGA